MRYAHRSCRSCIRGLPRTHRRRNATVIASTASPFKFCRSVIEALGGTLENDDVTQLEVLSQLTGVPAPAPLAALAGKTPRFDRVVDKADILSTVGLLKDL